MKTDCDGEKTAQIPRETRIHLENVQSTKLCRQFRFYAVLLSRGYDATRATTHLAYGVEMALLLHLDLL